MRHTIEEQVGGLVDHEPRRPRRREVADIPLPVRHELRASTTFAIRATRASDDTAERRVA
jgi:hypothetical protein